MNKLITAITEESFNQALQNHMESGWKSIMGYEVTPIGGAQVLFSAILFKPDPPKGEAPHKMINSPTIDTVLEHRYKQLEIKGYSIKHDVKHNSKGQLLAAALMLAVHTIPTKNINLPPEGWEIDNWLRMCAKPHIERMAIASALLIAEADRLAYLAAPAKA